MPCGLTLGYAVVRNKQELLQALKKLRHLDVTLLKLTSGEQVEDAEIVSALDLSTLISVHGDQGAQVHAFGTVSYVRVMLSSMAEASSYADACVYVTAHSKECQVIKLDPFVKEYWDNPQLPQLVTNPSCFTGTCDASLGSQAVLITYILTGSSSLSDSKWHHAVTSRSW
jgi:hypothetical protein